MNVPTNEAVGQRPHGVAQDVARNGLHDVLHELRAIAFDALPLLGCADALIGDGLASEPVHADLRLHIGQTTTGWQHNEQHGVLACETNAVRFRFRLPPDSVLHRLIHSPPEGHDVGVGLSPRLYQRGQLVFRKAHVERTHRLQSADAAAVAEGQFCDLAALAQVAIDTVLFHGYMKHGGRAGAVDIAIVPENLRAPFLPGQVRKYPRLYS